MNVEANIMYHRSSNHPSGVAPAIGLAGTLAIALIVTACGSSSPAQNLILDGSSFETGYDGFSALLAYSWTKHGLAGQEPRRGIIDATTAAHGKSSLKLQFHPPYGREGFSPWCTFRWIKIEEGQRYTVSLFAKGSRDGQGLAVSVSDNWQNWGWSNFRLSTEWQRYSHQITAGKTEAGYAWVLIPLPEDGTAWIDGVQVEKGGLTDYRPGRAVDLGVNCNHPTQYESLFFVGDKVVLQATVYSDLAEPQEVVLHYSAEDYFHETRYRGTVKCVALPKTAVVLPIDLGAVSRGSYKATLRVVGSAGDVLDFEELVFGVILRRQAEANVESQFGTHGFPHRVLEHCGVRWLRTYLLAWPAVEPEEGRWSWPESRAEDRLFLQNLKELQIRALPVLQGTPAWARTERLPQGGWSKEQSQAERIPRLDAWRRYVFQTVSRYKGRFQYWEVMNEPSAWMSGADYFPFLKAAHEEAKRADPQCRIVAGDTGWKGGPFFQSLLDQGALDYLDVFCGHLYGVAQAGAPEVKFGGEGPDAIVRFLKQTFRDRGKPNLEIWNTEEGTYAPSWYTKEILPKSREPWHRLPDVRRQARDLVRSHLIELGCGVRQVFWFHELYSEQCANARWIIRSEGMDGIEYDGAPRPAMVAYSVLTEKLEGAKPLESEVSLGEKVHCFVFAKGTGSVAAAWFWGDEQKKVTVALPAGLKLKVWNLMGNPVPLERAGKVMLTLDGNPLYIEAEGLAAQELFALLSRGRLVKSD
jgi:hypothetical protein